MRILGIVNHKDAGAALIEDGVIRYAANEERFTRVKLQMWYPKNTIEWIFEQAGISFADIDYIAYGWTDGIEIEALAATMDRYTLETSRGDLGALGKLNERMKSEIKNQQEHRKEFQDSVAGLDIPIIYVDHHKTHAYNAYLTSPFDKALVVTMDGKGDFKSASVGIGEGNGYREVECVPTFDSLGYFYGIITGFLGFKTERHEGKVTGLAAYGDPSKCIETMRKMIRYEDGKIISSIGEYYLPWFTTDLPGLDELKEHSREDVAAAVQTHLEETATQFIADRVKEHGLENLCLSGGLFGNVKMNQRIQNIPGVKTIFVHPNMGDGGHAVGAALAACSRLDVKVERPMCDVYLGPEFSNERIESDLREAGMQYKFVSGDDKVKETAELINNDKVIGWFQGRMEYGPRALGHRTVLYHPKDPKVNDWLNKRMNRTEFMPFAPVTTEDLAEGSFIGWNKDHIAAEFMTTCYDCSEEFIKSSPAVCHVDGTARPQVIKRYKNEEYHDVIKAYHALSGVPCLVNTSFNVHEEPIVCTPNDAIESYKTGMVDYLVIGDYIAWTD